MPRKPKATPDATLPTDMRAGKASTAKAANGDAPVFAYIASLSQPQGAIAERLDAIAATTVPALQRGVKWGMAYYGADRGWCFSIGGFDGHVKLMFINGATFTPVPPITPVAMGKATRGVELVGLAEVDEQQIASWMRQAIAAGGVGKTGR